MNNNLRAYIAGAGTVTAIGGDSNMNYHSVKAGISGYQSANSFTQAATGAVLINLAVQAQLNDQPAKPSLIYCSSDHRCRAAVRFEPISVASVQALQSTPLTRHVSS